MILKFIIFFSLITFLSSCIQEGDNVIDLSEITGHNEGYEKEEIFSVEEQEKDTTLILKNIFLDNGLNIDSLKLRNEAMFLDRFGPKSIDKFILIKSVDTILYSKWVYEDSSKVMNAFTNWINCFGNNCKSIFFGEEKNLQKDPFKIFLSDSALIFIEGKNNLDFKLWDEFYYRVNGVSYNYLVQQSRWSKVRWYTFIDDKRLKLDLSTL